MDKNLKKYELFIRTEVEKLSADKTDSADFKKRVRDLIDFHNTNVKNFQHERLVHLIITLFFAFLLLFTVVVLFIPSFYESLNINIFLMILMLILFVLELFYIRYYYFLENGTQKLYQYSKKLFDLID